MGISGSSYYQEPRHALRAWPAKRSPKASVAENIGEIHGFPAWESVSRQVRNSAGTSHAMAGVQ